VEHDGMKPRAELLAALRAANAERDAARERDRDALDCGPREISFKVVIEGNFANAVRHELTCTIKIQLPIDANWATIQETLMAALEEPVTNLLADMHDDTEGRADDIINKLLDDMSDLTGFDPTELENDDEDPDLP
jgi:hypothetical protein